MNMNQHPGYHQTYLVEGIEQSIISAYITKVFGWMFFGLLVTAATTLSIMQGIQVSDAFANLVQFLVFGPGLLLVIIAQFGLVMAISARAEKMDPSTAKALYLLYAISNGLTFGLITMLYAYHTGGGFNAIGMAFGVTAIGFGVMAVYGLITKTDLTRFGNILLMGVIGLIAAMFINMFFGSGAMDFMISAVGLFLFLGITVVRTSMIKNHFASVALDAEITGDEQQARLASNLAIVGALMLYLAFINMFFFILRLMGSRGRR